jgi:hypothetical protein
VTKHRGSVRQPDTKGADANGWTAEDRAAARTYRANRFGGGLLSERYRQDVAGITNAAPAMKPPDPDKNK